MLFKIRWMLGREILKLGILVAPDEYFYKLCKAIREANETDVFGPKFKQPNKGR
ncbi:hypothetical protein PsAD5_00136 [Pseudovibrio sp. Ad5]|uniref:hypothetical protein n=1 Tax=Pseudovibrio sp. Ad5 TaxID=989436 RepID=UPI0007B21A22|nr:hypothetical protein [Pseudovibrio sp. Ad5]KZL02187.1 hypothetical protein PsAD5_00136 [Pseudovibrio sp. Ad5]